MFKIPSGASGRCANAAEISALRASFPVAMMPAWFLGFLEEQPVIGINFVIQEQDDASGIGADFLFMSPEQIISESFDSEPGASVTSLGLLPIGSCALGSGNPYFIDMRASSSDPAIIRVIHDYAGSERILSDGLELVSPSFGHFLSIAEIA